MYIYFRVNHFISNFLMTSVVKFNSVFRRSLAYNHPLLNENLYKLALSGIIRCISIFCDVNKKHW